MVQGIGSQTNVYALKDLVNLAKYATGVPLTKDANKLTVKDIANYPTMLCGYEGWQWLKSNKGQYKQAFASVIEHGKDANAALKKSGVQGYLRISDAKEILANIPEAEVLKGLSTKSQELYKAAQKAAEAAKANPKSKEAIQKAASAFAKADAACYAEMSKNGTGIFAKTRNALGITKVVQAKKNLAAKSPTLKKCIDAYNNEAGTLALVVLGGMETVSNVVPTFKQLGTKKGFKQLGRSTAKVAASVVGMVAGSVIGTKCGKVVEALVGNSKVGAVIGSVASEVGSHVISTLGQHYAEKGVEKVLGKSELEKAREEEAVRIAEEAQNNPEVFDALVEQAAQRLAMEGEDTAESKAVNATLKNLVAQKGAAEQKSAPMMTRDELKAYAEKLAEPETINPVKANANGYTGYIPSAAAAPIKAQPQAAAVQSNDEMTPEMKALLAKADRVIANGSKYVDKK